MSAILALITVIVLVIASALRRKTPAAVPPVFVKRYIHPGHMWVRETADGEVLVGIDEFAAGLIGSVDGLELPRMLRSVRQGEVAITVRHGSRRVPLISPVTGRVVGKNEMVAAKPSLAGDAPYGEGWLLRIRPRRLDAQLHNLLSGKPAQQWLDAARSQLAGFFSGTPALMYQDGGSLIDNLGDRCSDEEWERLVSTFFLTQIHTK